MTCYRYLMREQMPQLIREVYARVEEAEKHREWEYAAAVKIQAWIRGIRVREYLRHLNQQATIIQSHWRGYLGRKRYREKLKSMVNDCFLASYNKHASKIQALWRGYYCRKTVMDFYQRKHSLENLKFVNEKALFDMIAYAQKQDFLQRQARERRHKAYMKQLVIHEHHKLSTTTVASFMRRNTMERYIAEMLPKKELTTEKRKVVSLPPVVITKYPRALPMKRKLPDKVIKLPVLPNSESSSSCSSSFSNYEFEDDANIGSSSHMIMRNSAAPSPGVVGMFSAYKASRQS